MSAAEDFDLMHTHMCSLGLHCLRAFEGINCAVGDLGARVHLRVLENAALCLAVDEAAATAIANDEFAFGDTRAASASAVALS